MKGMSQLVKGERAGILYGVASLYLAQSMALMQNLLEINILLLAGLPVVELSRSHSLSISYQTER
jgi:hypothetical protein